MLVWLSLIILLSVCPWTAVSQAVPAESNCTVVPCENGGTCEPMSGNCTCTSGFYGAQCQLMDFCASDPCSNGGTCELAEGGYRCICPPEFAGSSCETDNPCLPSPCNNSATCMIATGSLNFTCVCTAEYTGRYCETPVVAPSSTMQTSTSTVPLSPSPSASPAATSCSPACQNGGTCDEASSTCNCPLGWGGSSCEMELDIIVPRFEGRGYLTYGALSVGNTMFRVNFRTTQPNGMILYNAQTHDGSGGDFIQISIVNGFLDFRFDLGSGINPIQSAVRVDDGEWHEVQISRLDQLGLLVLDGNRTYMSNVSGTHRALNVMPPLFIGGVSSMVSLAPLALTVQGLTGCVYGFEEDGRTSVENQYTGGVNVVNCEGTICRFSLCSNGASCVLDQADMKGYTCNCTEGFTGEFCTEATCVTDPCLFGGTCVPNPSTGSYSCVCAFGFTGPNCETAVNITIPSFTGSSFITYNINPNIIYTHTNISLRVKPNTANSSGVLAFSSQSSSGGTGDFFLLAIDRGVVFFQFDCGSGSTPIRATAPLAPGEWSTIVVSRTAGSAMLYLNSLPPVFGSNPGTFSGLNIANTMYLGGVPGSVLNPPAVSIWSGFDGCITEVLLSNVDGQSALGGIDGGRNVGECEVDACFSFTCYNGGTCVVENVNSATCQCPSGFLPPTCANVADNCTLANPCAPGSSCVTDGSGQLQCQCPFGRDGLTCAETINVGIPSFNKSDYAHLVYPALPSSVAMTTTILVSILPVRTNGLILYSALHSTPENRDFVALIMRDGYLEFRFDLGSGAAVIRSPSVVTLNEWHDISAQRTSRNGSLSVDGSTMMEGVSPGTSQALNLATPVYVGGAPDYRSLAPSAAATRGFGGCIDNLVINGVALTLNRTTSTQDVQNCGEDPCDLLNCLNNGVCEPSATTLGEFVCRCMANYTGSRCELEIPDPCILVECLNGGRCVVDEGVARCGCPVPYGGDQCQDTISFSAARFSGFSYMEVHRFSFSSTMLNYDEVSLSFNTSSSNGLLLWVGGAANAGTDFMALGVNRGRVELRFNLGSGAVMLRPSQLVSDGAWHTVSVVRDGGAAVLTLDGRSSNVTSEFVSLDSSSNFWIGGHRDISSTVFPSNLRGCVRDLAINTIAVDLDNPQTLVSSFDITACN